MTLALALTLASTAESSSQHTHLYAPRPLQLVSSPLPAPSPAFGLSLMVPRMDALEAIRSRIPHCARPQRQMRASLAGWLPLSCMLVHGDDMARLG